MGEVATGIAALLDTATKLFTWVMTNLGTLVSTITSTPILLISFLFVICGFVVGYAKRLMSLS